MGEAGRFVWPLHGAKKTRGDGEEMEGLGSPIRCLLRIRQNGDKGAGPLMRRSILIDAFLWRIGFMPLLSVYSFFPPGALLLRLLS